MVDLERWLHYSQDDLENKLNVDEVFKKWVIIKNQIHMEEQQEIAIRYDLNPFRKNNDGYKYVDVPYRKKKKVTNQKDEKHIYSDSEINRFKNFFNSL